MCTGEVSNHITMSARRLRYQMIALGTSSLTFLHSRVSARRFLVKEESELHFVNGSSDLKPQQSGCPVRLERAWLKTVLFRSKLFSPDTGQQWSGLI